ncbi:hypothetical protein P3T73_04890 [Kiritimatiellota bacterium B12222]|nr:hypothetical protein P3T73_04890 [Kiritimatiellota bacterium B12222]
MSQPRIHLRTKITCVGLSVWMLGFALHWEILQITAWAGMINDYRQESTLTQAVQDTFSGEKPCAMCHQLTEEQVSSPSDNSFTSPATPRPDLILSHNKGFSAPSPSPFHFISHVPLYPSLASDHPPVPPPRLFYS